MILRVWLSLLLLSVSLNGSTPPGKLDGAEARAAIASFIQAFDNLDWDKFRLAFADDATVFYPRKYAQRASGRAEFEATFHQVFEQIRDGKTAPPFMDIQPRNMEIQNLGDTVIATFHLDDREGFLNRRTIVLHKYSQGWKIVHLHASEVALPDAGAPSKMPQ